MSTLNRRKVSERKWRRVACYFGTCIELRSSSRSWGSESALLHLGRRTANGHNGPLKRAGYAVSRLFITRTDSGGNTFNVSEVGGAGAAAISNLYYPSPERTWTKTYQRWLLNTSLDGMTVVFREFWPDINHAIFKGK